MESKFLFKRIILLTMVMIYYVQDRIFKFAFWSQDPCHSNRIPVWYVIQSGVDRLGIEKESNDELVDGLKAEFVEDRFGKICFASK